MIEEDPLEHGIAGFAARLRAGDITSEKATGEYLSRIARLDPRLGAYQYVAEHSAICRAREIDALRAAGHDLGPLMGLPISIKDTFVVDGMPTTAGSRMDVLDLLGGEGPFVSALRRAGCVILGKTKAVEFGFGITGISTPRGTPWNPWWPTEQHIPGGSSSGAGVSVAAGLCAFGVGGDSGGSVRVPAAMCGLAGLKTTFGLWSTRGVFPLAERVDTVGAITRTVADAALIFAELTENRPLQPVELQGLRLGILGAPFFDGLDPSVARSMDEMIRALLAAGASVSPVELPEAAEREQYFPVVFPACLIATLGRERFVASAHRMDPVVARRAADGLNVSSLELARLERRRTESIASANSKFAGFDAFLAPTVTHPPVRNDALVEAEAALKAALSMTRNTQPANYLNLPAVSLPLPTGSAIGPAPSLQVMCKSGDDRMVLRIALALEKLFGTAKAPVVEGAG